MKKSILIFFSLYCFESLMAQSHNRREVIEMLLSDSHHKVKKTIEVEHLRSPLLLITTPPSDIRFTDPIPKYCLPKGSIVCRFEEYIQLHTPVKLNIGLAGQ